MATVVQIVEAVDTYLESGAGLNITCIKGYPDFKQGSLTLPICAIVYSGSSTSAEAAVGGTRARIGASTKAVALTLAVYADDELRLLSLAQLLHDIRAEMPTLTAGAGGSEEEVRLYVGPDERFVPETDDVKEVRHMIMAALVVTYE